MKKLFAFLTGLVFVGVQLAQAQTVRITGTVIGSDDGMPLPGVSVVVKGATSIGVATNIDGKYELNAPAGTTALEFSFIGFETQVVEIAGRSVIDVTLASASEQIEEVVVTALGISREKKALGYAASSFSADEIASAKVANPMAALQGKVAGVEITTPAGPGTTQNVIIRGASSFTSNQPLYIVDGVPITNSSNSAGDNLNNQVDFGSGMNAINPDDIKDMTVLKGAAATALYGSRAANGVVMITTKSGQNTDGKMKVTYDGSYTVSRVGRLPLEQNQFGQGWSGDRALDENGNWGAAFDGLPRVWGNIVNNSQQIKPYVYLKNRVRDFYDFGKNYKNSISLYGGNEITNYYASVSHNSIDGVIPTDNDSYKRITLATRGSHKGKYITISSSVNYSIERTKAVASGQGTSLFRSLHEIATDISIVDLMDYNNSFNSLDNYFTPYGINPYYALKENENKQNKYKLFGKIQLDANPFENLTLSYRFGGDYETSIANVHQAIIAFTPGAINAGSSTESPGYYSEERIERIQTNHDFMANYNAKFTSDFAMNATIGLNINDRQASSLLGEINSIAVPGAYMLTNSFSDALASQSASHRRLIGAYANLDFSYSNYLFLTLTARNDWSSTLPKGNNSYFYPGATLSFLVTDLLDKQGVETGLLDFAKVRVALGKTGNDADPYRIYDTFAAATSAQPGYPGVDPLTFPINGINAYTVSNMLGNTVLEPELTTEFELGAELKFFNNRLGIDFSYYNKFTNGLISTVETDPSSGYTTQIANIGDVRNKGIELAIDVTPVMVGDFRWDLSWNYSKNNNIVEKLNGTSEVSLAGFGTGTINAVEGKSIGQFKFAQIQKVDTDGDGIAESIVVDGSGNPIATAEQQYIGKDINEKYRMGLTSTFSYKNFTLSGTFDFRYGGYMYSYTKDYMHWVGNAYESVLNDRNPFLIPNSVVDDGLGSYTENTTPVDPTALHTFYSNGGLEGDAFAIIDKSFLKLRNVSLSYNLPESLCKRIGLDAIAISANVSNILLWTSSENFYIDPEVTTWGTDVAAKFGEFGSNPTEQYYTIGLNLKF